MYIDGNERRINAGRSEGRVAAIGGHVFLSVRLRAATARCTTRVA
jgi:hypothetical protein